MRGTNKGYSYAHQDGQLVEAANRGVSRAELCEMFGISPTALPGRLKRAREVFVETSQEVKDEAELEAMLEHARAGQRFMTSIDPVLTHYEIDLGPGPAAIMLAGCFQTGGRWTFHSLIRDRLEQVLTHPRTFTGFFGDEIDNFAGNGFAGLGSSEEQPLSRPLQRRIWDLFMKRMDKDKKILWGLGSQHGTYWDERGGSVPIKEMYTSRNIPFFDGQAYIKIHVGQQTYQFAVAHEFPGSSMWNIVHPQKRASWQRYPNADVIAQADRHQYAALDTDVYGNEVLAGNRASTQLLLVQIGTAKVGPDKYMIRGWERGFFEWPWIVLYDNEHKMRLSRDTDEILWRLGKETGKRALEAAAD